MKRIGSFLLALALVLGLCVTGFAAGTPVGMSNYLTGWGEDVRDIPEGGTFKYTTSVNVSGWHYPGVEFVSSQRPVSAEATLEGGKKIDVVLESTVEEAAGFRTSIQLRFYDDYTPEEVGQTFAGTLTITMEDGSTVSFLLENKIIATPEWSLSFFDKNGNQADRHRLKLGETYTVRVSLRDDTDALRQKYGVEQISARWMIENGNGEAVIQKGSGAVASSGEWVKDENIYTVDYSAEKLTEFPFELVFTTKTIGKFDLHFECYYDSSSYPADGGAMTYFPEIVDTSNIVSPGAIEQAIENPGSEGIVIDIPKNVGLDESSFENIWEKANGRPVTLNANGAKLTFDTSEPLPAEFLRDLANRNDNFFNPAVYSRIPEKAQKSGYRGGRWMEFMYSGVLPGKMTVTVDIPKNTFPEGSTLRLWYYDSVTGRASLDPTTVTLNGSEATFAITHCSAYALYEEGYDPNPNGTQKPDDKPDPKPDDKPDPKPDDKPDNKPGSGSSSGSGSGSTEETFGWADMREEIRAAKAGDTLRFTVSADEKVPASLLRALKSKEEVTLILRYGNSKSVTLSSDSIGSIDQESYRFNELQQLFASQNDAEDSGASSAEKENPGTGAPEKTGLSLLALLPLGAPLLQKRGR